jgi:hypothetical protein
VLLVVDHILPVSAGGPDDLENLTTACSDCNAGKSNRPLSSLPEQIDLGKRAAELTERAEQIRAMVAAHDDLQSARNELQEALCKAWEERFIGYHDCRSLLLFSRWFTYDQLLEAMEITLRAYGVTIRFKYFCGVIKRWRQHGYGNFGPQEQEQGGA